MLGLDCMLKLSSIYIVWRSLTNGFTKATRVQRLPRIESYAAYVRGRENGWYCVSRRLWPCEALETCLENLWHWPHGGKIDKYTAYFTYESSKILRHLRAVFWKDSLEKPTCQWCISLFSKRSHFFFTNRCISLLSNDSVKYGTTRFMRPNLWETNDSFLWKPFTFWRKASAVINSSRVNEADKSHIHRAVRGRPARTCTGTYSRKHACRATLTAHVGPMEVWWCSPALAIDSPFAGPIIPRH